jgi:hypothetical protein
MPDGSEIEHFEGEDECLCGKTDAEILSYAIQRLPDLKIGEQFIIERDAFGWNITKEKIK